MQAHEWVVLEQRVGPPPSTGTGVTRRNGSPGQTSTAKKKLSMAASAAPTHGISSRCRDRYRLTTSTAQPLARSVQNRIEPSSAAHREMNEKKGGVVVALLRAT